MKLSLRARALAPILVVLALSGAGCERTNDQTATAETHQLIVDPARLSLIAGASGTVRARALDATENAIEGARIDFSSSDQRLLSVDSDGVITSLGPVGHASILIANGFRSLTVPVDVVAGPARRFEAIGGTNLTLVAGTTSKAPIRVRLVDAFDNPIANAGVKFDAAISPPLSLSTSTGTDGIAIVTLPVVSRAGPFILNARTTSGVAVSLQLEIQVSAGAPEALEAVKVLASGPVALVPDFELVLRVRDALGNPVPNVLVRWRTNSGSSSFDPPESLSGPDGLVRTRWQITKLKGRRATLRAFVAKHEAIAFQTWIALER